MNIYRSHVLVCSGKECAASGSPKIKERFEVEIRKAGLAQQVKVIETDCAGLCEAGPIVIVYPEGSFYCRVSEKDVAEIVREHLVSGNIVKRLLYREADDKFFTSLNDAGFYQKTKTYRTAQLRRDRPRADR